MATEANRKAREGLGKQFPNGRMVIDNRPIARSLPQDRAIPGMGPLTATPGIADKRAKLDGLREQLREKGRAGQPQQIEANPSPRDMRPRVDQLNGTRRTGVGGKLDVTFDPSTPLAARQAFMTDPVKPEAQMARFDQRAQAAASQALARQQQAQARPQLFTKANSPAGMGWQQRTALNEQLLRNQQADAGNRTQLETTRMNNQNQIEQTGMQGEVTRRGQDLDAQGTAERNRIEQGKAATESQSASLENEGRNIEIRQALEKERDFKKYSDPETTEVERQTLARKWNMKIEQDEYDTKDIYNDDGYKVGQELFNKRTGEPKQSGGQMPPLTKGAAAALEEVKKGKGTREHFLEFWPEYAAYLGQ